MQTDFSIIHNNENTAVDSSTPSPLDDYYSQPDDYYLDMYSTDGGDDILPIVSTCTTKTIPWTFKVPFHLQPVYKCKVMTIKLYETSTNPQNRIRKAITGAITPFRVGTRHEDLFFVVHLSTGYNERRYPVKLYFDSPHDFEKHCFVQVSEAVKNKWHQKLQKVIKTFSSKK